MKNEKNFIVRWIYTMQICSLRYSRYEAMAMSVVYIWRVRY